MKTRNSILTPLILILSVTFSQSAACQSVVTSGDDERADRIAENLKYRFSQLRNSTVLVQDLTPSATVGFYEGVVVIDGRNRMRFLTTNDDSRLYLLAADPIDASLSVQEIALEMEKERMAQRQEAEQRHRVLLEQTEGMPSRGAAEAPVTIVEYSDFECPFCSRVSSTVKQVLDKYPDQVRLVYRHFPLSRHPWAEPAAIAAVCAAEQSNEAFWTLHDNLFQNQAAVSMDNYVARSKEWLEPHGLDIQKWSTCAEDSSSDAYAAARQVVLEDMSSGRQFGVTGTPAFFVNGRFLSGNQPLSAFDEAIADALGQSGQ
jgi:protein-disulfide isomerase